MEKLEQLLDRWEDEGLSADELCPDDPALRDELALRIRALTATAWMESDTHEIAVEPLRPPSIVGRYRLEVRIGHGGHGQVWRAFDPELDRRVAVKLPLTPLPSGVDPKPFLDEARRVAGLNHSSILTVHDAGIESGFWYIVSPLIEGGTLADSACRLFPLDVRLSMIADVAGALAHAHTVGFLHRDVKSRNILFDENGRAYLADFGLSSAPSRMTPLAATLAYAAPELLASPPSPASIASDVYSLGVVLHEVLTGSQPGIGSTPEILRPRGIPNRAWRICRRMLSRDPDRRPDSATIECELHAAIRSLKPRFRWGTLAAGIVVGVALVLAWSSVAPVEDRSSPLPVENPILRPVRSVESHVGSVTGICFLPDGKLVTSGTDGHSRLWNSSTGIALADFPGTIDAGTANLVAAGKGEWYSGFGRGVVRRSVEGEVVARFEDAFGDGPRFVAVSSNGSRLVACSPGGFALWDVSTGKVVFRSERPDSWVTATAAAFSPDGNYLLIGYTIGPISFHDGKTGKFSRHHADVQHTRSLAYFADGRHFLSVGNHGVRSYWDAWSFKKPVLTFPAEGVHQLVVAVNMDGVAVVGDAMGGLWVWDRRSGRRGVVRVEGGHAVRSVAWPPDHSMIVTGSDDGVVRWWAVAIAQ